MFGVMDHPAEQQALAHIITHHNPFYRPSLFDSWFGRTPVEELAHMRHHGDSVFNVAAPMPGLDHCHCTT